MATQQAAIIEFRLPCVVTTLLRCTWSQKGNLRAKTLAISARVLAIDIARPTYCPDLQSTGQEWLMSLQICYLENLIHTKHWHCLSSLRRQSKTVHPNVMVLCGDVCQQAFQPANWWEKWKLVGDSDCVYIYIRVLLTTTLV
jgi:hypothetical protein